MQLEMLKKMGAILIFTILVSGVNSKFLHNEENYTDKYTSAVEKIKTAVFNNTDFKHQSWERTAMLVDSFGSRLWGSESLEHAIRWLRDELIREGFENVRLEEVPNVPKWVRGKESMTLYSPRPFPSNIPMIGLGKSLGGNVTAEVVMFHTFEELEANPASANGKIVFFNAKWISYGEIVKYRSQGASMAAKHGAVGCIIRSIASESIENPHTGAMNYNPAYPKIPAAAVSLETADMFARMIERGQRVVINLYTEGHYEGLTTSYNVVGEIIGSEFPEEVILMGGHIDSWDVGPQTGANDDAAGFMVCFDAIRTLIKLGLRPKRTVRFIAWSGEEMGEPTSGAQAYVKTHAHEMENHVLAFESDAGTRKIYGWGYSGNEKMYLIVNKVNELFLKEPLGLKHVNNNDGDMVDTEPLLEQYQVPTMRNIVSESPDNSYYFTYHHSAGDSMNVLDPDDMDSNVAAIASLAYIIGDLPNKLPRA